MEHRNHQGIIACALEVLYVSSKLDLGIEFGPALTITARNGLLRARAITVRGAGVQVADMLTKALSAQVFPCHIDTLLGKPPTEDLLHYLTNLLSTMNGMSLQTDILDNFPDYDSKQYTL